jgi:signal transduction histidine kinase/ligand-binding sensor domain-containing protein
LGTYHGLVRFDGVRFKVFDSQSGGLPNGLITSLYEDPNGVLWIGHETGQLSRYSQGRFQMVDLGRNWKGGAIEGITSDSAGDLWLLNEAGVLFRARDGQSAEAPGGASASRKVSIARGKGGKIWVVANGTVANLEEGKLVPAQFPDAQITDYYERVLPSRDGGLWVLGNERIRKFRQGNWVEELPSGLEPPGAMTVLLETRSGALLAGTLRDGLFLFPPGGEAMHFSRTNGLSHNWVRSLCEDHEGNIWVGTSGGLDELRTRKVQMLNPPDGWQGCAVLSFSVLADNSAWIGTEGAGLYHYARGEWSSFGETNGLSNAFVWSVLATRTGDLFVGTWGGGLVQRAGDRFVCPGDLARMTEPVLALYQGRQGELWVGTRTGLHRYEHGRLVWSAGPEQLTLPDVRAIAETSDGTLWFGMSGGGLGQLKGSDLKQFRKADGLGSDYVVALHADPDGVMWIGTSDNGLIRLKHGKFVGIGTKQGLPSNVVYHIVDDGADNLWLGSEKTILRVSKDDLDRCADGLATAVHSLNYGKAEGLASEVSSGGFQPGACKDAQGRLWFPTAKGVAIINPANASTNAARPPVVIEEMLVDSAPINPAILADAEGTSDSGDCCNVGNSAEPTVRDYPAPGASRDAASEGTDPLRVGPGSQRFEFRYTGLSFTAPEKVRFKYKLEGLEPDWSDEDTKRVVQYNHLRPGNYTFRVTACNNDGLWNDKGASLAFTVVPYFYQTWWFEGAGMASGAGAVGLGVLWATRRRLRRRLEQLERQRALERERARIARDIHDDLGASLTRIGMLSQSVRGDVEAQPQTAAYVDQIYHTARELTRAMDEIVWAVNPTHDTLDSLVTYLGRFAQHFLSAAGIRCRLDVPMNLPGWALTAEVRHNVFLALKEALNNVVKHARATEVRVALELEPRGFVLTVADNGCGFDFSGRPARPAAPADSERVASGNGLLNMQRRLEEIGGKCEWNTAPGEGTRVRLVVLLKG